MIIRKLLMNRKLKGALTGFFIAMLVITGVLSTGPRKLYATDAQGNDNTSSTLTVYKWTRINNDSELPQNKRVKIVLVRGNSYVTLGNGITKSKDDWKHYHDEEEMQYFTMTNVPVELQVTLKEFYTINSYAWWSCQRSGNKIHLYTANGSELVADDDDNDSCLDTGSFADGENCWRYSFRDGTYRFQHYSKWYDEYMGTTGNRIWCENTSNDPGWGNMDGFVMYVIEEEHYTCLNGNITVQNGQVLNIATGWVMKPNTTLTIEPGGVVNVMGKFWCNGTIKNYGTLILREGAEMYSFALPRGNNYNASVCSIDNYGGGVQCNLAGGGKEEGEGILIIMKDAFLMTNMYSDSLDFYGSSVFANYGTAILHNGLSCSKEANKQSDAEIFNYGEIALGASIDPTANAPSRELFDFSGSGFKMENSTLVTYRGEMNAGVNGSASVKEIKIVKSVSGDKGSLTKKEITVKKTGVELFRYVNDGIVKLAANASISNSADIMSSTGMGTKRAESYNVADDERNGYTTNLYALSIGTGFTSGKTVQYIGIRYVGIDNVEHTEYLFPSYGGLRTSFERAKTLAGGTSTAQKKQDVLAQYGVSMKLASDAESLAQNSNEDYIFRTAVPVREFLGFDLMNGSQEWTCKYMALYEVDKVNGIDMKGYISSDCYVDYSGTRVFIWEKLTETNVSTDQLFRFRCRITSDTTLENIDGVYTRHWSTSDSSAKTDPATLDVTVDRVIGSASGRLTITNRPAIKSATKAQAITIDMGSVAGAGISGFVQSYDSCISINGQKKINANGAVVNNGSKDSGIGSYKECLTLRIRYYDTNNIYTELNIPVLYSTLCYLCNEAKLGDSFIYGLGQADDTLSFKFTLPGYDSSRGMDMTILYGAEYATEKCGIEYDQEYTHRNVTPDDEISLVGIQIYDDMPKLSVTETGMRIKTTKIGNPVQYYTAPTKLGTELTYDDSGSGGLDMKTLLQTYDPDTSVLSPRSTGEMYMVEMTTSIPTKKKTYITFGYTQQNGKSAVTNAYCLQDEVESYYGLWTAYKGGAYELTAKPGGTFYFLIDAKNASKFEYAIVRVEGYKGESDMQISSFKIFKVGDEANATGSVSYSFDPQNKLTGYSDVAPECYSYWHIERTVSTTTPFVNYVEEKLVRSGSQEQISFAECSSSIENINDVDWDEYAEYMSYSSTQQDMGYTKVRNVYTVTVKVAADSDVANSDSGSKNQFYFQLLFDSGDTTGYVLANQQLLSDGFRSGYEESFKIYSNYDYGDIAAVRIIPDDQQEGADIFDKLCIEYITISKQTNAGIARTWRCEINDWVGIDYTDTASTEGVKPQQGRTEAEMARAYAVTQKGYDVLLVVEFETGDYKQKNNLGQEFVSKPIVCSLNYEITYTNQTGQLCLATGDAAAAMYEFMDYEPLTGVSWTGSSVISIDKNNMLRPNSTNKFIVALDNPKTINSIRFTANGDREDAYTWKLGKVKVYRIVGGTGALYFDTNRNYCRRYDMTLLTESTHSGYKTTVIPVDGRSQSLSADFRVDQDNEIEIDSDLGTWTSTAGRLPDSAHDNLIAYLFMNKDYNQTTSDYDMKLSIEYVYDGKMTVDGISTKTVEAMQHDDGNMMFYSKLATNGFKSIQNITLTPVVKGGSLEVDPMKNCYADYIMIVQERLGVIVDVFYIDLHRLNAPINLASSINKTYSGNTVVSGQPEDYSGSIWNINKQTLSISIGDRGSNGVTLSRDEQNGIYSDIGFSINYTLEGDPTNAVYSSPNYFLSDYCEGEIKPHQQFTVETALQGVKEIKTVKFFAQGDLKDVDVRNNIDNRVNIDAFSINSEKLRQTGTGVKTSIEKVYYISDDLTIDNFLVTENQKSMGLNIYDVEDTDHQTLAYATISIKTKANTAEVDAGCNTPIWGKLTWVKPSGEQRSLIMTDLNDYLQSGSFASGDTAVITVPLYWYHKLHSISFEPYDDNAASSTWAPEKITVSIRRNDGTVEADVEKVIDKVIYEGNPTGENINDRSATATTINLANISFAATAGYYYEDINALFRQISLTDEEMVNDETRKAAVDAVLAELGRDTEYGGKYGKGMNFGSESRTDDGYNASILISADTTLTLKPTGSANDVDREDDGKFIKGSFGDIKVELYEIINGSANMIPYSNNILRVEKSGNYNDLIVFSPTNDSADNTRVYMLKLVSEEFADKFMTIKVTVDKSLAAKVDACVADAASRIEKKQKESQESSGGNDNEDIWNPIESGSDDTEGGSTEGGNTEGGSTEGGSTEGGNTEGGNTEGGSAEGGSTEGGNTEGAETEIPEQTPEMAEPPVSNN